MPVRGRRLEVLDLPYTGPVPTKTLADLDGILEKDPEYRVALERLSRRETLVRKLIRFRLKVWRSIRRTPDHE